MLLADGITGSNGFIHRYNRVGLQFVLAFHINGECFSTLFFQNRAPLHVRMRSPLQNDRQIFQRVQKILRDNRSLVVSMDGTIICDPGLLIKWYCHWHRVLPATAMIESRSTTLMLWYADRMWVDVRLINDKDALLHGKDLRGLNFVDERNCILHWIKDKVISIPYPGAPAIRYYPVLRVLSFPSLFFRGRDKCVYWSFLHW